MSKLLGLVFFVAAMASGSRAEYLPRGVSAARGAYWPRLEASNMFFTVLGLVGGALGKPKFALVSYTR